MKKFSKASDVDDKVDHAAENRRLKRELMRVTEERDILKKPPYILPEMPNEVCVY